MNTFNISQFLSDADVMLDRARHILEFVSEIDEDGWVGMSRLNIDNDDIKWELTSGSLYMYYEVPYDEDYRIEWEVGYELFGMDDNQLSVWVEREIASNISQYELDKQARKELLLKQLAELEGH